MAAWLLVPTTVPLAAVRNAHSAICPSAQVTPKLVATSDMALKFSTKEIGRAGKLCPGKTYKLMRALRKHALNNLDQLWMLTCDRRHEKGSTALVTASSRPTGAGCRSC